MCLKILNRTRHFFDSMLPFNILLHREKKTRKCFFLCCSVMANVKKSVKSVTKSSWVCTFPKLVIMSVFASNGTWGKEEKKKEKEKCCWGNKSTLDSQLGSFCQIWTSRSDKNRASITASTAKKVKSSQLCCHVCYIFLTYYIDKLQSSRTHVATIAKSWLKSKVIHLQWTNLSKTTIDSMNNMDLFFVLFPMQDGSTQSSSSLSSGKKRNCSQGLKDILLLYNINFIYSNQHIYPPPP